MPAIVIGGGITGLSAAWTLAGQGAETILIDPGPLGGLLRTECVDGCIVECGADSWIRTKPWLRNLAAEVGLEADIIPCNEDVRRTFIFRDGRLLPLPRGLRMIAPTEWRPLFESRLIGWKTKFRMLAETRRKPFHPEARTVADLVLDHFGPEALEYLAEPLFAGVYGGNPESLGAAEVLPKFVEYERACGSLIRGARRDAAPSGPLFESMREGLGQIPQALVARLGPRVQIIRASAERIESGRVRAAGNWIAGSPIILACGAPAASELLSGTGAGAMLSEIPHSSATIFAFGFRRSAMEQPPNGFGFLVPRSQRQTILAGTWVTNKFPGRAPAGKTILRCFVSGDHSESLLPDVRADLKRIAGVAAEPLFTRVYRWPNSMPQYGVGHAKLMARIHAAMPGDVRLAGAFVNGVGMPDCAKNGSEAVEDHR